MTNSPEKIETKVKHKRTPVINKRPDPLRDLDGGQLGLNTNPESPGLYFRTDPKSGSNEKPGLVKIGPAHVSDVEPNPTNYTKRCIGELWFNPETGALKVWAIKNPGGEGSSPDWIDAGLKESIPTSPESLTFGDVWNDGGKLKAANQNIPTTNPNIAGAIWYDGKTLKVSTGS